MTKKQNKRYLVRNLRRILKRTLDPIRNLSARRIYRGRWGEGITNKLAHGPKDLED